MVNIHKSIISINLHLYSVDVKLDYHYSILWRIFICALDFSFQMSVYLPVQCWLHHTLRAWVLCASKNVVICASYREWECVCVCVCVSHTLYHWNAAIYLCSFVLSTLFFFLIIPFLIFILLIWKCFFVQTLSVISDWFCAQVCECSSTIEFRHIVRQHMSKPAESYEGDGEKKIEKKWRNVEWSMACWSLMQYSLCVNTQTFVYTLLLVDDVADVHTCGTHRIRVSALRTF